MDDKASSKEIQRLTFGAALEALKRGGRVARAGWNGQGMWLSVVLSIHDIPREGAAQPVYRLTMDDAGVGATALPWIGMKTADNKFVPWLASQTDVLADDWSVCMNDQATEQEIRAKGLTAPRVTPGDIEASEHYFTAFDGVYGVSQKTGDLPLATLQIPSLGLITFCVLVLRNGYTVTGESVCESPGNFDAELGRKIARQDAVGKVWPLMGYALKQKLYEASNY